MPIQLDDIRAAHARIQDLVQVTPVSVSRSLSERLGTTIHLKLENQQTTGSFKVRGSLNKILSLAPADLSRGLIAASAGNHAQGVAYAAARAGARARIVMPETAPLAKVLATQNYGGEVILRGRIYDEAYAFARELATTDGATFIHPFEDPFIIAGQGTLGLELLAQIPNLDSVVVPIGGGGLASGVATALKALKPSLKIYGVVSEASPGMLQMFRGLPVDDPSPTLTIADGISVKRTSPAMFKDYIRPLIDGIVAVSDEEIAESIVYFLERAKTLVEGSGAVVLAGLEKAVATKLGWSLGGHCALILSGGNIDLNLVSKTIERGLSQRGRLRRFSLIMPDRPGTLMKLTNVIALAGANIIDVTHDRNRPGVLLSETVIDFLLETRSPEHAAEIERALEHAGARIIKELAT